MSMWDILYATGIGFSFFIGIAFGSANNNEGRRQQHETLVGLLEKKNVILEEMLVTIQSLEINK